MNAKELRLHYLIRSTVPNISLFDSGQKYYANTEDTLAACSVLLATGRVNALLGTTAGSSSRE